jgi:repressor LexA
MTEPTIQRQTALLRYIHGYQQAKGYAPSYREMGEAIGLASKNSVDRAIRGLEQRGCIRRLRFRWRSVEVIKVPAIPAAPDGAPLYAVPLREAC